MTVPVEENSTPAEMPVSSSPSLLDMAAYDEAYDLDQSVRPHWQQVMDHLERLGPDHIENRYHQAQRILRDDGVTYNLNTDPLSPNMWSLDIIPQIIHESEWEQLETGLAQRSTLFDLIFKDLYGKQRLLKEGIVPSEIVFAHPGFLRPCHGIQLPGVHHLIFHAIDLVRAQNGQFIAIGDRAQAPSGTGYVLENRTAVSRVLPSLFRHSYVRRLSSFFHTVRHTLASLASHKTDTPRIVVLTPGAYSSTYFEHAYLANYLGFPLVQGGDLTVRNGKVWLKSLNGLSEVDVILRRMDDTYCDQTELRADSRLGVPGLLEVARQRQVVLANPLGSGLLEAPAFLAFLPEISQFLLGEPLKLASVRTRWCGFEADRQYVIENINSLIIKPAYRSYNSKSIYGHSLTPEKRAEAIKLILANPEGYVAQSYIPGSIAPVWNDQLEQRHCIYRAFSVANGEDYTIMPGSLCRVADSIEEAIVTDLTGVKNKDTWIVGEQPDTTHLSLVDPLPRDEGLVMNLPSRVIENLFWFGRYAERAEMSLRLMRTIFQQLNGVEYFPPESREVLLSALTHITGCYPGFIDKPELLDHPNKELTALVIDSQRIGSIKFNLHSMLSCGEQVKEMLSADTRIILNELRDHIIAIDNAYKNGLPDVPEESLDNLVTSLLALSGLNHESMLRGMDWIFQEIGRRAERARLTAILLRSTLTKQLPSSQQQLVLESVLLSVEALISYRRRYRGRTHIAYGLDLLMIDDTNPRSLIYQIKQLQSYLRELPRNEQSKIGLTKENKSIIKALNELQLSDLELLGKTDEKTKVRSHLEQLMQSITTELEQFTSLLSDKYFDHTDGPQQLLKTMWKADL